MRLLTLVMAYNDKEVIEASIEHILAQTHPIDKIILVDNGSTDGTATRVPEESVTILVNEKNFGTSGAFITGFQYAKSHGYDWMWVLDADSRPRTDALKQLVLLYESFASELQNTIGVLSSSQLIVPVNRLFQGRRLTPGGPRHPIVDPKVNYIDCDAVIWSGSLVRIEAVDIAGLPRVGLTSPYHDFSFDCGDTEFFFRIKQSGFRIIVHKLSMIEHPIGNGIITRVFGRLFMSTNHPPWRRYTFFRNLVYFWIYVYPKKNWLALSLWFFYRLASYCIGILLLETNRKAKLLACLIGTWEGLFGCIDGDLDEGKLS